MPEVIYPTAWGSGATPSVDAAMHRGLDMDSGAAGKVL